MNNTTSTIGFLLLLVLFPACALAASSVVDPLDGLVIRDDRPADNFEVAYPVGNGRLGAMPFGSFPQERILLNEESIWANPGPMYMAENLFPHLEKVRELEDAGDYAAVDKYFEANISGSLSP